MLTSITGVSALLVFLARLTRALPASHCPVTRDADTVCGQFPAAGIRRPANGSAITVPWDQYSSDKGLLDIVYCSGTYSKTSSINITSWIDYLGQAGDILLGSGALPQDDIADAGFYGYRFAIPVSQEEDGSWDSGWRVLYILEAQTGYCYPYGAELPSVTFSLTVETETTATSRAQKSSPTQQSTVTTLTNTITTTISIPHASIKSTRMSGSTQVCGTSLSTFSTLHGYSSLPEALTAAASTATATTSNIRPSS